MDTLTQEQLARREKTEMVLSNIYNLPPMPNIMTEVLRIIDNKTSNTSELNKVISKDHGLVTKILTIANSPLYGLQRKVTTIDFAILILGFSELRNIVSTLSMIESFKNKTDKHLDQKEFWLHSFLIGSACKRLAEDLDFPNSGEAFVAGFLHDIGISVMHRYLHTNFVAICELAETNGKDYLSAELEILGMPHQEIGYMLLERWNFPLALCDAIKHHHDPAGSQNNQFLTSLINLADYMTQKLNIGAFKWDNNVTVTPEALKVLRLTDDEKLDEFIESYKESFLTQAEAIRYIS